MTCIEWQRGRPCQHEWPDKENRRSNFEYDDSTNVMSVHPQMHIQLHWIKTNSWLVGHGLLQIFLHRLLRLPPKKVWQCKSLLQTCCFAENSWQPCLNCQVQRPTVHVQRYFYKKKPHCTKLDWWWHSHSFCSKTKDHHRGKSALSTHPHSTRLIIPNGLSRRR